MLRALNTAASGMVAQEMEMDVVSNNIANVSTNGFKKRRVEFQDLLYENMTSPSQGAQQDEQSPVQIQVGQGVRAVATVQSFTTGPLLQTDNPFDFAIEGDGFFQVRQVNGSQPLFTRDGSFKTNSEGRLVTSTGLVLEPNIVVPTDATQVTVSRTGVVQAYLPDQVDPIQVGQLQLTRFLNPGGMLGMGGNLYEQTEVAGQALVALPGQDGSGLVVQGFLEGSNVKVIEEMIQLITTQRAYETNSKIIQAADEMLSSTANLR